MTDSNPSKETDKKSGEKPLIVPKDLKYNCSGCGKCCGGWSIGLTEADWQKVKDVDWNSLHPDLEGLELFVHREDAYKEGNSPYPHFTNPKPNGRCPFVVDNLCFIHSKLGAEAKPGTCQIFPYSFIETPTAVYAGVAYSSWAATMNEGDLLSNQKEMLEEHWQRTINHLKEKSKGIDLPHPGKQEENSNPFDMVTLTGDTRVPWSEYLYLDEALQDLFRDAMNDKRYFLQTVLEGEEIVLEAVKLAKADKSLATLKDFKPEVSIPENAPESGINDSIIAMVYYLQLSFPAIRQHYPSLWFPAQKNFDMKHFTTVAKRFGYLFSSGLSAILFKKPNLPGIGTHDLKKSLHYKIDMFTPEMSQLFNRWVYMKIFAKTYFGPVAANYSVLCGYNSLVAKFLCAVLYTKSLAMEKNQTHIDINDLYEAFVRLERAFFTVDQLLPQVGGALSFAYSIPKLCRPMVISLHKSLKK